MQPVPYVFFNGDARAALVRWGEIFGTTPDIMDASGAPPEMGLPKDRKHWVMHGHLRIGDGAIMASDNLTGTSDRMTGSSVMVSLPTAAEGRTIFDALADGGTVTMPWEPTFWSAGFGTCVDRFGVRWMVGTDEEPAG